MSVKQKIPMIRKYILLASAILLGILATVFFLFPQGQRLKNLQSAIITENVEIINTTPTDPPVLNTDYRTGAISITSTGTKGFARQFTLTKQTTLKEAQFYAY
jgi:archaellum component FlaG (FlaF/FlaG flagellin family)